jgi:inorganic pyrophosphatase
MLVEVFIQNEAGSNRKNYHDEKTLQYKATKLVSRAYPYPYGFILGTNASDGCNIDVFVITKRRLETGQRFECEVVGLMEQFEDGIDDHNILARLPDESAEITAEVQIVLTDFVLNVFRHVDGKRISVGRFRDARDAEAHIKDHLEPLSGERM